MKIAFLHIKSIRSLYTLKSAVVVLLIHLLWIGARLPQTINEKPVLEFITDMEAEVTINVVYEEKDIPMYFTARLQSPVCMENLCNPVDIKIEWDLLGDFMNYKEVSGYPLTKFDHEPLTDEDHEKLKGILANKESLLQDYRIEDLVDTSQLIFSEEIDGMTGATSKTFENDIVPGAVYTCYVLWNFVNGPVSDSLLAYTKTQLSENLLVEMIHSQKKNYLDFVLNDHTEDFSTEVTNALGSLIWDGDVMISVKAVSAVNDAYWQQDSIAGLLAGRFSQLAIPVQNALIRHFQNKEVSSDYLSVFITLLPEMNNNQRRSIYDMFKSNAGKIDEGMKVRLASVFKTNQFPKTAKEYELMSILGMEY